MHPGNHLIDGGKKQRPAAGSAQCGAVVPGADRNGFRGGQSGQQLRKDMAFIEHHAGKYTPPEAGLQPLSPQKTGKVRFPAL